MILVGSLAASILIIGITPPYIEIWKRRGRVVGISKDHETRYLALAYICSGFCIPGNRLPRGGVLFVRFRYISSTTILQPTKRLQLPRNILISSVACSTMACEYR